MVLYFSATGNTEFVAQEIAKRLDDECVNLLTRIKTHDQSPLHSEKPFVICAPIYVCEMPRFLAQFFREQTFTGSKDVHFIFTSGGYCGIAGQCAKWLFKKKGMNFLGYAEVTMPRNYVINDHYPMLEKEEVEERITNAYGELDGIAETIRIGGKLEARHVALWETVVTLPFNPVWCKLKLRADDFYAEDSCIGCGKCAKLCPLNNIQLVDKKPVWGNQCTHCMACIGNCPTNAIKYSSAKLDKEPYNFGKYRYVVKNLTASEK